MGWRESFKDSKAGIFEEILSQLKSHALISRFQLSHFVALIPMDIFKLRIGFRVLDQIEHSKGIALSHDFVVADETLVEVNHLREHFELLLEVEDGRDSSRGVSEGYVGQISSVSLFKVQQKLMSKVICTPIV